MTQEAVELNKPAVEPEALPCPFCGGPAAIEYYDAGGENPWVVIECADQVGDCLSSAHATAADRASALERWNTRAAGTNHIGDATEMVDARFALAQVLALIEDEHNHQYPGVQDWHRRNKAALDAARAQFGAPGNRTAEYERRAAAPLCDCQCPEPAKGVAGVSEDCPVHNAEHAPPGPII